ncbi:GGDEF domain-containing protein [Chitinilyticum piscinae]|uniref:diguanylate cyclase n=1 Tax=Chitinilyticum piscinae TaxID=2866724 RepID=A0A8J7FH03_9NEIS|nr:diguanylate cyclase [Chitinilyticum piscinae]MBE9608010.1 diguanylate cyclase [Chitinilyticum piscinae]
MILTIRQWCLRMADDVRLLRWALVIVLLLQLLLAAAYLAYERHRLERFTVQILRNTSLLYAQMLEQTQSLVHYQCQILGNRILRGEAGVTDLQRAQTQSPWIAGIRVLDATGEVVDYAGHVPVAVAGSHAADDEQALKLDIYPNLYVLSLPGQADQDFGGLVEVQTLRGRQGQLLGSVQSFISNRRLNEQLNISLRRGFDLGQSGRIVVIDRKQSRIAFLAGMTSHGLQAGQQQNWQEPVLHATAYGEGVVRYHSSVDGSERIGVLTELESGAERRWMQVISIDRDEYLHSWYSQLVMLMLLFPLLALLQWQLAHVAYRNRRQRLQLAYDSRHDPLTGLANRRHFDEWAGQACSEARRYGQPLSLLALDLDHFKRINDRWGHDVGDKVLVATAGCIRQALRECDLAARFGGEEFVVALPQTSLAAATSVAERIRARVSELRVDAGAEQISMTVSIGITGLHSEEASADAALLRADEALYAAKHGGRNQVCVRE